MIWLSVHWMARLFRIPREHFVDFDVFTAGLTEGFSSDMIGHDDVAVILHFFVTSTPAGCINSDQEFASFSKIKNLHSAWFSDFLLYMALYIWYVIISK